MGHAVEIEAQMLVPELSDGDVKRIVARAISVGFCELTSAPREGLAGFRRGVRTKGPLRGFGHFRFVIFSGRVDKKLIDPKHRQEAVIEGCDPGEQVTSQRMTLPVVGGRIQRSIGE